jgi:hypothetical protein
MRLSEVEKKARSMGVVDTWRYSKADLIKEIQRKEGSNPCFGKARGSCMQYSCCWLSDCVR